MGRSFLRILYLEIKKYIVNMVTVTLCFSPAPFNWTASTERNQNNSLHLEACRKNRKCWAHLNFTGLRWISATALSLSYYWCMFSIITVWWWLYAQPVPNEGEPESRLCRFCFYTMHCICVASMKVCKTLLYLLNFVSRGKISTKAYSTKFHSSS